MMRSAAMIFGIFCVATLLSQAIGLAVLWHRGQLHADAVRDIAAVLSGQDLSERKAAADAEEARASSEQIMEQRVARVFDLGIRETELSLLKAMLAEKRADLLNEKTEFEKQRREFEERLRTLDERLADDATDQARGVLQALPPADAVANLMQLELEENVVLLQGMNARSIGRILKEFGDGTEDQQRRGREIFAALSHGEPVRSVLESAGPRPR